MILTDEIQAAAASLSPSARRAARDALLRIAAEAPGASVEAIRAAYLAGLLEEDA